MVSETFKTWLIKQYEKNKKELFQRVAGSNATSRYIITAFYSDQMKPVAAKYDRMEDKFVELQTSVLDEYGKEEDCTINILPVSEMRISPGTTYSFEEAVNRIIVSDYETIETIAEIISEERHLYCLQDLESLAWIIKMKRKLLEKRKNNL
jgi:hypothetical protein